jgi:hypothetical protein
VRPNLWCHFGTWCKLTIAIVSSLFPCSPTRCDNSLVPRSQVHTREMPHEISINIPVDGDATEEAAEITEPAALLAALATDHSIQPESVGALPLPFAQPDVEHVFQAQHVRSSTTLAVPLAELKLCRLAVVSVALSQLLVLWAYLMLPPLLLA